MLPAKALLSSAIALVGAFASYGQGTVLFGNRVPAAVDAPVLDRHNNSPADSRFVAQLYAAPPGGTLLAVGDPVPFLDGPGRGYIEAVPREIPDVVPGGAVQVKMVAWYRGLGESFVEVVSQAVGGWGESIVVLIPQTGGGQIPPAPMEGLVGFFATGFLMDLRPGPIVPSGLQRDPVLAGQSFDFVTPLEWVRDVAVSGSTAFVAASLGGLHTFDIRNPAQPVRLGWLSTDRTLANAVAVTDRHAFVATSDDRSPGSVKGLSVIDITDPADLQPVARIDLPGEPENVAVTSDNTLALVGAGSAGLQLVDVHDPSTPGIVGVYEAGDRVLRVETSGGFAYVTANAAGMHIVDVRDPAKPSRVGVFPTLHSAIDVAVRGPHAFVTGLAGVLYVVDITDPSQPRGIAFATMSGGAGALALGDRHVYVEGSAGITVIDISNPEAPRLVGRTTVARDAMGMAVQDDQLWVADTLCLTGFRIGPGPSPGGKGNGKGHVTKFGILFVRAAISRFAWDRALRNPRPTFPPLPRAGEGRGEGAPKRSGGFCGMGNSDVFAPLTLSLSRRERGPQGTLGEVRNPFRASRDIQVRVGCNPPKPAAHISPSPACGRGPG